MMEFEEDHEEEEEEEEEQEEDQEMGLSPTTTTTTTIATVSGGDKRPAPPARYRECLKNHAVGIGGQAVDGCGEFMPAGADGTLDALKCAACNCHRNFHRKELLVVDPTSPHNQQLSLFTPRPHHHQQHHQFQPPPHQQQQIYNFYPYNRTTASTPSPTGYLHMSHPRPLPLPSPTGGSAGDTADDGGGSGGGGVNTMSSSGKKRFRTKFSQEQKDKMLELAEKVGWRIQKQDEGLVQQFCNESGVKRHVLKVWMHNNKHTLGKKP